jgi:excisionase family DNA binding protein
MAQARDLRVVHQPMSLDALPDVLTVEEAAKVLRIGRGAAYELARQWRATGGREGLPVVTLGRSLRVPRAALRRLLEDPVGTSSA